MTGVQTCALPIFTYTRVDSGTIEFDLDAIPPTKDGQGVVINYTVQISY